MAATSQMAEPGDLIEIKRGKYSHWGLYVGDGYIIHITADELEVSPEGAMTTIAASMGLIDCIKAKVRKEKLTDIAAGDKWSVSNYLDEKHKIKPIDVILREAEELVDKEMPYSFLTSNCEHFATNLRYGFSESRQAQEAIETGNYIASEAMKASLGLDHVAPH